MRLFMTTAIVAIVAAAPMAARAADPLVVPLSSDQALAVTDTTDTAFDWNGFYGGVYGVAQSGAISGQQYGIGIDLGVNARFEFVLVGAEIAFQGLVGDGTSTSYLQTIGRVGVAATDDLVLYAAGGVSVDLGMADETDALVGGGLELAVTEDLSLRGQYLHGIPLSGANPKDQLTVGANFHF